MNVCKSFKEGFYTSRVACSYRDHWNFGRIVVASGLGGSGGCETNKLQQQCSSDIAWLNELRECLQSFTVRLEHSRRILVRSHFASNRARESLVHCEGFGVLQVDPCRYGSGIGGPEFKVSTGSMLMQPNVAPAEGTDYETNTDEI